MIFQLTLSTNGESTRICHKWKCFCHFWYRLGCALLWLAGKVLQKWIWVSFFIVATHLFCKAMCTITTKQHKFWFLFLKRDIKHVRAGFTLFTVVKTRISTGLKVNTLFVGKFWTKCISINISNWFFCLFKFINPIAKLQQKRSCLFLKGNIAHLTHRHTLQTMIVASVERLKSLFPARKVYPNTLHSDNTRAQ